MEILNIEQIPNLIESLGQKQPFILTYLMATGSDILNQHERETLLFMGVVIWKVIFALHSEIPVIQGELLDEHEEKNIQMLQYLAGEPESEFMETVERIMAKYHQKELLRYLIDRLVEDSTSDSHQDQNNIGMIAIYLKTIIDSIDTVL